MSTTDSPSFEPLPSSGIGLAVSAYLVWGLSPIYWKGVAEIPAAEVLIPRILWSLGLLVVIAIGSGRVGEIAAGSRRAWLASLVSAVLLATNWGFFIFAVQTDRVLATSLGYYINPLMSVLLGLLILGERLNRLQTLAVGVAAFGVVGLTLMAGELPWISLVLALSFAIYGLSHKLYPQPPLGGLLREMLLLSPLASLALAWRIAEPHSALANASASQHAYLALAGAVTITPLLLFHAATKRLPLVAVGMFQYIAPTITLALATFVYHEPFELGHGIGFGLVWLGLALFTLDNVRRAQTNRRMRRTVPFS